MLFIAKKTFHRTGKEYQVLFSITVAIGWSFFMCVLFLSMMNMMINIPLISSLIALGSAIIYSAYIVIDTQLMIMGTGKTRLSLDNYILGAIFLYLDIIGLFLKILRIIGKKG